MEIKFKELRRDRKNYHYTATIEVNGVSRKFEIHTSYIICWHPWLDDYNILDRYSLEAVSNSSLRLSVAGLDEGSKGLAKEVEEALIKHALEVAEEISEVL